ncbi:restriction endonuclease [Acidimicrobium ferrooxidans]|nr:restriction endonuclease [Acidimicrobium ferrooxidans]
MSTRLFVFRTHDASKEWLWGELQAGRLHQGWGELGMELVRNSVHLEEEKWIAGYSDSARKHWNFDPPRDAGSKRFRILQRLLEIQAGDVVVIPKMPEWRHFTVARVEHGYQFDEAAPEDRGGQGDFRHFITVDTTSVRHFSYTSSPDARAISGKFRAYQAAINNVWSEDVRTATQRLLERDSDSTIREPADLFREMLKPAMREALEQLRQLPPLDLEKLVGRLFEGQGYEVLATHRYDRDGGDADLILGAKLPLLEQYIDLPIYVQVKQKHGHDPEDTIGVKQLLKIASDAPTSIKVLASTADDFSEECQALAEENGVTLIGGAELVRLLVRDQ